MRRAKSGRQPRGMLLVPVLKDPESRVPGRGGNELRRRATGGNARDESRGAAPVAGDAEVSAEVELGRGKSGRQPRGVLLVPVFNDPESRDPALGENEHGRSELGGNELGG